MRIRTAVMVAALLVAVDLRAQAPAANQRGFFIGFDPLAYAALSGDAVTGGRSIGGTGVSLRFGWGFSERWAFVMDVPVTDLPLADSADYLLSHGDLALQYRLRPLRAGRRALVAHLQAGVSLRSVDATLYGGGGPAIYSLAGEALSLGGGVAYYVLPSVATTLNAWWTSGAFNDERIGNTTTHNRGLQATSYRVQAGVEWHAGRR